MAKFFSFFLTNDTIKFSSSFTNLNSTLLFSIFTSNFYVQLDRFFDLHHCKSWQQNDFSQNSSNWFDEITHCNLTKLRLHRVFLLSQISMRFRDYCCLKCSDFSHHFFIKTFLNFENFRPLLWQPPRLTASENFTEVTARTLDDCVPKTTLQIVHFPGFFVDFSNT